MTQGEYKRAALRTLLKVALPVVEQLPSDERIDALEGIAIACGSIDPEARERAQAAAEALRAANASQLLLRDFLK